MSPEPCDEMRLLIQAELDGELDAARAAGLARHLADCPACAEARAALGGLSARIRAGARYHRAPAALRDRFAAPPPAAAPRRRAWAAPFGAGAGLALAACLALFLLLPRPQGDVAAVIDDH